MDSPESLPQLRTPEVPEDFNGGVGVEFARELLKLVGQCQVTGGNLAATQPFDVATLQNSVANLTDTVGNAKVKQRKVAMNGVNNGEIIVPFADIGTISYGVDWAMIIDPGDNPPNIGVAIVDGSKETGQVKVRIDGLAAPFSFEFVITEIKSDAPV